MAYIYIGRWNDRHLRAGPRTVQRRPSRASTERIEHHEGLRGEVI